MIGHNLLTIYKPAVSQDTVPESLHEGVRLLWKSYLYASDARATPWDFAVEIDRLYECGLTACDLRWLVAKGFVNHARETSQHGDSHRQFSLAEGYSFDESTSLILTSSGLSFCESLLSAPTSLIHDSITDLDTASKPNEKPSTEPSPKPKWHPERRELSLGENLVKRFRVPARNQELILSAFEEENWPERIYDPLPSCKDITPRTRLHDAINRLNGCQSHPLIRFHGNGTGDGIVWSLRSSN